jgi:uncharacterized protein
VRVFADTSFWVAYLIVNDPHHSQARQAMGNLHQVQIVTSELVVVETLNFVSRFGSETRQTFSSLAQDLLGPNLETYCVRQNENLLRSSLELYGNRGDKDWSFVDCCSITIMSDKKIQTALTADHHFEQAGFSILLK